VDGGAFTSAFNFVPARLTLAREAQGWTMRALAERINTTSSAISQFESGKTRPSGDVVRRLAFAFGVAPSFFAVQGPPRIDPARCHFRHRRTATQMERRVILARGEMRLDVAAYLAQHVNFPVGKLLETIPTHARWDTTSRGIEHLADAVRDAWELGHGPISNAVRLLEEHGILPVEVPGHSERLDAFSTWVDSWPIIFIATEKHSATRRRFDVIHELGHLLLHPTAAPGDPRLEREADAFASAFLLPRHPFELESPKRLVWPHLLELKARWKVSLAALVRRAYDLNLFSEATYRRAFVQLSKRGWRRAEPDEPELEHPTLLREAMMLLLGSGFSSAQLAADLGRNPVELEQLVAGSKPGELSLFG
jgi:Zn-dependent peptidase ImmA (M78 family)/DNA-binding XRE family transcriptional regulator